MRHVVLEDGPGARARVALADARHARGRDADDVILGRLRHVVAGVGRLSLHQVIKGVNPFLLTYVLLLSLFVVFPQIVTAPVAWMR